MTLKYIGGKRRSDIDPEIEDDRVYRVSMSVEDWDFSRTDFTLGRALKEEDRRNPELEHEWRELNETEMLGIEK